jgi:hypothetical protein
VVIVVVATFQTDAGRLVIDELIEESERPREVEAVSTDALVFAFTTAASEDVAIPTRVSVFALIAVWLLVIAEPSELVAVSRSESVARLPDVSPAPVRVRVVAPHISAAIAVPDVRVREPADQMSATSVPKEVRVLPENAQMELGNVAESDDEAFSIAVSITGFISAAMVVVETMLEVISNVLSPFTKLPFTADPQLMTVGHTPTMEVGVNEYSYQLLAEALIAAAFTAVAPVGS